MEEKEKKTSDDDDDDENAGFSLFKKPKPKPKPKPKRLFGNSQENGSDVKKGFGDQKMSKKPELPTASRETQCKL